MARPTKGSLARDGFKICSTCRLELPVSSFYKKKSLADGFYNLCKTCGHESQLKSKFGLANGEYDKLLIAQKNACAICLMPEEALSRWGTPRLLSVDHCHKTGKVRGLLCHSCNLVIGKFQDDQQRFKRAIEYLNDTSSTSST